VVGETGGQRAIGFLNQYNQGKLLELHKHLHNQFLNVNYLCNWKKQVEIIRDTLYINDKKYLVH